MEWENLGDNGSGYSHIQANPNRFVVVLITITEGEQKEGVHLSIYPKVYKGYRDPFEERTFDSVQEAKDYAEKYFNED